MNSALPKIVVKTRKNSLVANPFVYIFNPFVGSHNPQNIPLICKKRPYTPNRIDTRQILGFTLIELLVTMAVATILITVAIPNFRVFVQNSRITAQTNDLISDISYARSEAIKSGATATLCSSTAGFACDGGGNWTNGRLVWVDLNGNGVLDPGEARRFREQLAGANTLNVNVAAADPLTFSSRGAQTGAVAGQTITFNVCDDRGVVNGRDVIINPLGQTRASGPPATLCL